MDVKWTKNSIALEIINLHASGEPLNYGTVSGTPLLSAAMRNFGSWRAAVEFAGLDYSAIRRYRSWTTERITARIRELHAQGADLSWNHMVASPDSQLAAAAIKKGYFGSWRSALEAAGLDYDSIRRYREWDEDRVVNMVRDIHAKGEDLNAKNVALEDIRLITAARRRFESWPEVLTVAGLDYRQIVRRAPFKRGRGRGQNIASHTVLNNDDR